MSLLIKVFFKILILIFLVASNSYAAATYVRTLNVSLASGDYLSTGIGFNNDGTTLYLGVSAINNWTNTGTDLGGRDWIREWDLSTAWDISTATRGDRLIIKSSDACGNSFQQPSGGMEFSSDGKKVFTTNKHGHNSTYDVCQITLSTAYDITSASSYTGIKLNAGATDVGLSFNEAQGVAFNNDGTKMFVGYNDEGDNPAYIFEFDLSTGFDVGTATYDNKFIDLTTHGVTEVKSIAFSKDGISLFVVENSEEIIQQFALSKAFDLSSTLTLRGTFNDVIARQATATGKTDTSLRDMSFNDDGTKVYITMGRYGNNGQRADKMRSRVHEYDLDCPYSLVYCESPVSGSDKDLIGVIESYTEMSKRVMKNNIKPVMHRLEWLRRHRKEDNLTNQNLKFNFSNEMLASLSKVIPIANKESSTNEKQKGDWFFWSEGQISIGDIEATSGSSRKELDTNGITIGADKKASENKMYGYALQFGRDSADIGNSAAILDTDNYSLVFYGTIPHEDGRFLDAALGLSTLKTYHLRKKNSVNLSGKRAGKQAFGSIKLNKVYYKKNININPTAKFDFGFTELNTFQESGSNDALIYEKHQIPKGFASLGMLVDKTKKFNNGNVLKPMARLEYTADFSPSTNTNVSYVGTPSTDHFIRIGNQSTHNYKAGLGFDLSTVTGWSVILNYEIDYANGSGHTDNFNFITGWVPNRETEYALSIDGSENIKTGFNIVKKVRGFDLKFNIDTDLLNDNKNHNSNISLNKVF